MKITALTNAMRLAWQKMEFFPKSPHLADSRGRMLFCYGFVSRELIMRMKYTILMMVLALVQVYAKGYGQKITLKEKHIPIAEVLSRIEKEYGYVFFYDKDEVQTDKQLDLSLRNADIHKALASIFSEGGVEYKVFENTVVLRRKPVSNVQATRQVEVRGKVTDSLGEPLAGVSIRIKGTKQGTTTNSKGGFLLQSVENGAILIVSFIGSITREVPISLGEMHIVLQNDLSALNEIVVVGYSTQSKAKLLGSVSTINAEQLASRPVTNVSTGLSGLAASVQVKQGNGRPGSDGATIRVRGTGTLNNSNALVIIDGIQGVMDAVNPEDIETISILKDASSAAIYGARAANGVILITTKKGSKGQKPQINYSGLTSRMMPSVKPTFVSDYLQHMQLFNEAAANVGNSAVYTQSAIDLWTAANADPNGLAESGLPNYIAYPNTNWGDWIYDNNWLQNHNVSVLGGSETSRYNISARIQDNPGILYNTGMKRYEGRINFESDITSFLTVGTQTFANMEDRDRGSDSDLYTFLRATTPGAYPVYNGMFGGAVDGSGESPQLNNPLVTLYQSVGSNIRTQFNSSAFVKLKVIEGLSIESTFNYQFRFDELTSYNNPQARYDFSTLRRVTEEVNPATMTTTQSAGKLYRKSFDNVLRYNRVFGDHTLSAILGHNEFYYNSYSFGASQRGLIDESITNIGSANEMVSITGNELDNSMRSFFGRLSYDYQGKYLMEFSLRKDGSSKFGSDRKYGTFPSVALGYNISREPFMKTVNPYLQDIKIRGSWGRLGNDGGDDLNVYGWQGTFGNGNYSFAGSPANGLWQNRFGNDLLQWEESDTKELGIEFTTLNRRLFFETSLYDRLTTEIIRTAQVPITTGLAAAPFYNQASMRNSGIEFNLRWQHQVGDFSYHVGGNFAYNKNRVTHFEGQFSEGWSVDAAGNQVWTTNIGEVSSGTTTRILEGHPMNAFYTRQVYKGDGSYFHNDGTVNINGGPTTGMIRTDQDYEWAKAMKAAGYSFVTTAMTIGEDYGTNRMYYGDLVYADLNGDGIYGNNFDQYFTGTSGQPKYVFGFNLGLSYKGFDMSAIFAGESGLQYYWTDLSYNSNILTASNQVTPRVAENRYFYNPNEPNDPRTNQNGYFPRLKLGSANEVINNQVSDYWLYDANFFRLRNLQLGYSFKNTFTERFKARNLRVFFSGENLFMWTRFPGLDPEVGAGAEYPTMRQYALGINVGF